MNSDERQAYQQIWQAENREYLNEYMKWYRFHNKPNKKPKREYVASDKKHNKMPVEPKPAKPARRKMTHIEKTRRKIERNLDRIEARRKAWRDSNISASIITNETSIIDTQG